MRIPILFFEGRPIGDVAKTIYSRRIMSAACRKIFMRQINNNLIS